ncbi:hypothetical protein ISN45_Aa07g023860 [Arabidopsis thaliana x Arabidopsis arenosa]|uniref:Uncharacterized protein n=1 Tax=Arabidopsis thaliana x Arabidopsis arenosa TaxID=1240361 RepID=A0A8T1YB55_9BRAS|nr:hypothetical protein ISN45_Aa07g023860 [Arabidopsis thaliana x Arabidopsis arenosa]
MSRQSSQVKKEMMCSHYSLSILKLCDTSTICIGMWIRNTFLDIMTIFSKEDICNTILDGRGSHFINC